jgi:hypothetical protein
MVVSRQAIKNGRHGSKARFFQAVTERKENMEKKLYRVKVVLFVMAENESDACVAATRARFDIFECTARKAKNVDSEWNDAIPYNADDERACSEIIASKQEAVRSRLHPVKQPHYTNAAPSRSPASTSVRSRRGDPQQSKIRSPRSIHLALPHRTR